MVFCNLNLLQPQTGALINFIVSGSNSGCPLHAAVAQLVEQLICNQQGGGSNPLGSSIIDGNKPNRKEVTLGLFQGGAFL